MSLNGYVLTCTKSVKVNFLEIFSKTQHKAQLFSGLYTVLKGKLKSLFHPSC